jgi:hypothetical protein
MATVVLVSNLAGLVSCWSWAGSPDRVGRRWSNMVQAAIACVVAPVYLLTHDVNWIIAAVVVQGFCRRNAPPTWLRPTTIGFYHHVGVVFGGFVPGIISYLAVERHMDLRFLC